MARAIIYFCTGATRLIMLTSKRGLSHQILIAASNHIGDISNVLQTYQCSLGQSIIWKNGQNFTVYLNTVMLCYGGSHLETQIDFFLNLIWHHFAPRPCLRKVCRTAQTIPAVLQNNLFKNYITLLKKIQSICL